MLEDNDASQNASFENDLPGEDYAGYLERAVDAHEDGRRREALLFYLVAYEKAMGGNDPSILLPLSHPVVDGLKCAWLLCLELSDRSMAEHVFELINGYLTPSEMDNCSMQLQSLALSQLKEFGLSEHDVDEVADIINKDVLGSMGFDVKVSRPPEDQDDLEGEVVGEIPAEDLPDISELPPFVQAMAQEIQEKIAAKAAKAKESKNEATGPSIAGHHGYADLVGFDESIEELKRMGYGMGSDDEFRQFVNSLKEAHGIDGLSSYGTLLFRSYAREDATRLMLATAVEMNAPTVRMYMDENAQGMPLLCVIASQDFRTKSNVGFNGTVDSGVLVLEDVDLWGAPFTEPGEEYSDLAMAQLTSGVRRAVALIRSAVDNPNVTVLASASSDTPLDEFIIDMLGPVCPMDIPLPGESQRLAIWDHLFEKHPSLAHIDKDTLVRLSFNLSRYDIFYAAREAVEQSYKESIARRECVPVVAEDLFEKLAAFQPLASAEYRQLEDAVVERFKSEIDELERFLGEDELSAVEIPVAFEPGIPAEEVADVAVTDEAELPVEPDGDETDPSDQREE